jgi:murein DD-endopeptidase MepM/ murein hydrolase activator NlpD
VNYVDLWGLTASDTNGTNALMAEETGGASTAVVLPATRLSNWPVNSGTITSQWGPRDEPVPGTGTFHSGIDIAVPNGTPVYATGNGTVVQVANHTNYGNVVVISMDNGLTTADMHLNSTSVNVTDRVIAGQQVGTSGQTGTFTTGGHDHFTVWDNPVNVPNFGSGGMMNTRTTVNPVDYLPARPDSIR